MDSLPRTKGCLPGILRTMHSILNCFYNFFILISSGGTFIKGFELFTTFSVHGKIPHGKILPGKIPPDK